MGTALTLANDNYISFVIETSRHAFSGRNYSITYFGGLTIDINNGKILRLKDIIIDIDSLIYDIQNKERFAWLIYVQKVAKQEALQKVINRRDDYFEKR